jgi:diguanylate cyclase (GGDEF)-like protein
MIQTSPGEHGIDSAVARQLEAGFPWLRFRKDLEPAYRNEHFERNRLFVRIALIVGLLLSTGFFLIGRLHEPAGPEPVADGIRFGLLTPAFLLTIILSFLPRQRTLFRRVLLVTALIIGLSNVALNLMLPPEMRQLAFAGLPVVLVFVFFALGLFMQTALVVGLIMTAAYTAGAFFVGMPVLQLAYNAAVLGATIIICALVSYVLEYAMRSRYLESQLLSEMVEKDGMTGLYNRRAFDRYLEKVWAVARRQHCSLTVMLADIDFFKAYNDHHGHQAGDECLKKVASAVSRIGRRPLDFVGRFGGEEFIVALFDVDMEPASDLAERLRNQVAGLRIPHHASKVAPVVTISVGVAVVNPAETPRSLQGVIQLADQSLYQAKKNGRNQVVVEEAAEALIQTGVFKTL